MNYNHMTIAGNLTRAPELRHVGAAGTALCKFSVAINDTYTVDGEKREKTHFVDCVAWGKTAENIALYFKLGQAIFVDGQVEYSTWKDKTTGATRTKLEMKVLSFQFVGPKSAEVSVTNVVSDDDGAPF